MAPDTETEKQAHIRLSHALLSDEIADSNQDDEKSPQKDASIQQILKNSLDQAMPHMSRISETVEELGSAASKTIASVREWSTDDSSGAISNPRSIDFSTAEQRIAALAACCKPLKNTIDDDTDTMVTFESADEHARMLQRLTSWNTLETMTTVDEREAGVEPQSLQPQHQELNKKCVQFDYPPVQAMTEIPRMRTQDLPSLFFSEEELYQLRGDRLSTISAEDVEVVAINSAKEESLQGQEDEESSSEACLVTSNKLLDGKEIDNQDITESTPSVPKEEDDHGNEKLSPSQQETFRNVRLLTSSTGEPIGE